MTAERIAQLHNGFMEYIYNHNESLDEYVEALDFVGFTVKEIYNHLVTDCGEDKEDALKAIDKANRWCGRMMTKEEITGITERYV